MNAGEGCRAALELDVQAARLQSQLDYVQAADEMNAATHGRTWSDSPADAAMTFGSHAILAHQDGVFPLSGATHRGKRH